MSAEQLLFTNNSNDNNNKSSKTMKSTLVNNLQSEESSARRQNNNNNDSSSGDDDDDLKSPRGNSTSSSSSKQQQQPQQNENSPRNSSSASFGSTRSSVVRATVMDVSAYELHEDENSKNADVAKTVKTGAQTMFDNVKKRTSMFRANLTTQAWVFIVLVALSVLVLFGVSGALLWEAWHTQYRVKKVGEDLTDLTICTFQTFKVYLTTSASYSMSDLMIGCFFSMWYAFRAVRYEKEALLVVFALVVLGVTGRAIYFSFVTAHFWVTESLNLVAVQVFLCLGVFGLLVAVCLTWRVGRSFGWRMYTKGASSAADVDRMSRLKTLDAAAKLDLFLTINAFNTFFFFLTDNLRWARYVGFAFTAITALFLLAIPVMVKKRMFFVAYIFVVVGLILPVFYVLVLVHIFGMDPQHCVDHHVKRCAFNHNITRIPEPLNFTDYPRTNSTMCFDCLNTTDVTQFGDQRLCWARLHDLAHDGVNQSLGHCIGNATKTIDQCCRDFGRCELKEKLVDSNAPMAVFVVCCAIVTRIATLVFGVQQARNMDIPKLDEMLRRAERNISSFASSALSFSGNSSGDGKRRSGDAGDDDDDDDREFQSPESSRSMSDETPRAYNPDLVTSHLVSDTSPKQLEMKNFAPSASAAKKNTTSKASVTSLASSTTSTSPLANNNSTSASSSMSSPQKSLRDLRGASDDDDDEEARAAHLAFSY